MEARTIVNQFRAPRFFLKGAPKLNAEPIREAPLPVKGEGQAACRLLPQLCFDAETGWQIFAYVLRGKIILPFVDFQSCLPHLLHDVSHRAVRLEVCVEWNRLGKQPQGAGQFLVVSAIAHIADHDLSLSGESP